MADERIPLKNPVIAGVLAFLIPGAGHLYQGRYFKSGLYAVCILGAFFTGMILGEWKVVAATNPGPDGRRGKRFAVSYVAQFTTGLVTMPALLQSRRYFSEENHAVESLSEPFESDDFLGTAVVEAEGGQAVKDIKGTVSLQPANSDRLGVVEGTFEGTDADGNPVSYRLGGAVVLGPPILASDRRELRVVVIDEVDGEVILLGAIEGTVPRPLHNWYQVPLSPPIRNDLIGRLSTYYDLAAVFTWIAGFLNIFAIWDAIEGPAYGYGDEPAADSDKPLGATGDGADAANDGNSPPKDLPEPTRTGSNSDREANP